MKKFFTIFFCAPFLGIAQNSVKADEQKTREMNARATQEVLSPVINKLRPPAQNKTNADKPLYGAVTIGTTEYDLQSNNSVDRRLQKYTNNRMTAVWTTSTDASPFEQRGTGYNQYTGTAWRKALPNNARFESSRVGWPTTGMATFNGVDKEYVFAHAVANSGLTGGFIFSQNTGIGTDFVSGSKVLNDTYNAATIPGPIWSRAATAGSRIVLLECFTDSSSTYPGHMTLNGVRTPIVYSIYDATTDTWVKKNVALPDYDSTRYTRGSADDYAIDASGNKVRIVIGGTFDDLALWSSDDGGNTWTKTVIDSFKRAIPAPRTNPRGMNNGTVSVLIDGNGVTHVAWAITCLVWDSVNADKTFSTYVFTNAEAEGIFYWNDKKVGGNYPAIKQIGEVLDMDGDNVVTLAANTRSRNYGGYGGSITLTSSNASISAVSNQPMLSYDANGNVFCTYISPVENDESPDAENYNDIFVVYSKDGGTNWAAPQNLTKTSGFEDVYPSITKVTDSKLRVMYFLKDDPGVSVNNTNNPQRTVNVNYMEIPVSKILSDSVGKFPNGINPGIVDNGFMVDQNYPNPFQGTTQIDFTISVNSNIQFTVVDMLGKVVYSEEKTDLNAGNHSITFNAAGMGKGIYFYTISNGVQKFTEKMIVE